MNLTVADIKMVKAIILSELTAYSIGKNTGISRAMIGKYRSGEIKLENMTFENALKLTQAAENYLVIKSSEILDWMKNSKRELDFVIKLHSFSKDVEEGYLMNQDTGNLQTIYSNHPKDSDRYYGVYGDATGSISGQVDSRQNSDKEILAAIQSMLLYGNLVKREDVTL